MPKNVILQPEVFLVMKRLLQVLVVVMMVAVHPVCAQKIGVSLAGGAALGYAHLGLLKAMDEAGIKPDCIVGTSMGAIVGMLYAAGYSPEEILQFIKDEKMDRLTGIVIFGQHRTGGLISTDHIQKVLLKYVPHNNFDSLKYRFYCCSFNVDSLRPVYKGEGDGLVKYVMASSAIPMVFSPVWIDNNPYVDGGIYDNMPIQPLLDEKCDVRIGSLLLIEKPQSKRDIFSLWVRSVVCGPFMTSFLNVEQFTDVVMVDPEEYWLFDFNYVDELFQIGYEAGKEYFSTYYIGPRQ